MNRRGFLKGTTAAALVPALPPIPDVGSEIMVTMVNMVDDQPWPFHTTAWISHRRDLSDLGEPYLSAVRAALCDGA